MVKYFIAFTFILALAGLFIVKTQPLSAMPNGEDLLQQKPEDYPTITLAGGCFWCLESEFRAKDGILYTFVGYTGGKMDNPSYQDITTGQTGHAEAVQITYDPEKISEEQLLRFFFTKAHDPTTLNRQGVDKGTQYRSAIFYEDQAQKQRVEAIIKEINDSGIWQHKIVTKLEPASTFWLGEEYHQQYYEKYEKTNGRKHMRVLMKHKK